MRTHGLALAAVLVALALGCTQSPATQDERCRALKRDLDACLGTPASRLDCSSMTETDMDRLGSLTQGQGCALLASAVPLDGDLQSATCRMLGVGCTASLTPKPERRPAKYPVLLVNGIDSSPLFRYSPRIVKTMTEEGGQRVYLANLTPYETPNVRAPELWKRIQEVRAETGAAKVNLICHSLGGLDCRYLVSPNGLKADLGTKAPDLAGSVASITTVGTAHRGTRVADMLLGYLPDGDRGKTVNDFATLVGDWFDEKALGDVHVKAALQALSVQTAPAFNAEIRDAQGIYYQSWAGFSRPFGEATPAYNAELAQLCKTSAGDDGIAKYGTHDYMALALIPFADVAGSGAADGSGGPVPNDGLATVTSAKWGTFRGCIAADHQEQLGQRNIPDVNVRSGFDVARFYTNVATDLAQRGF